MRDLVTWSLPIGRLFGITVRIHLLFYVVFMAAILGRGLVKGYGPEALLMLVLLFVSVLLHEFGHCFAARRMEGDATEILMWPLGGLASVDIPNTPRAHFVTAAWGPLVNLFICLSVGLALAVAGFVPPLAPWWNPIVLLVDGKEVVGVRTGGMSAWSTGDLVTDLNLAQALLARLFWVNWILFLFNVLLIGFPLDGGRMLQSILWVYLGFRQATVIVIYCGYAVAVLLFLYGFFTVDGDTAPSVMLLTGLALFIAATCWQQARLMEMGSDESTFGYDFSQGYTSLERDQQQPRRKRQSWWQRWWQQRAERKRRREEERRQAEEQRLDELLAKIQRTGKESLTEEERRFMTRVSARYRNRD